MDASVRALRLLQCSWFSSSRSELVVPLETVIGILTAGLATLGRNRVQQAISNLRRVARLQSVVFRSLW